LNTAVEFDALEQVLADADAGGITIVAGAESAAALPMAFLNRCPARWVLHLHDPHDAALLGVAAKHVPPAVPGRIVIAGSESTAQLLSPRPLSLAPSSARTTGARTPPIRVVSSQVLATRLPTSRVVDNVAALYLGIEFSTGEPFAMEVPEGEHLLLVGAARSGRSTGLARVAAAWASAYPNGWVGAILPRRSTFPRQLAARVAIDTTAIAALLDELSAHLANGPALLVIDDAELVDDVGGRLAGLATSANGLCVAAAGRPDAMRQTYGHWTGVLRRSRLGLVATGGSDLDGDLLSVQVPRHSPVPARPGLWWVADNGAARLMQLAIDERSLVRGDLASHEVGAAG
jgi:S-DNA-T family DNA segregation ATPase FtsK/SpoIIIE